MQTQTSENQKGLLRARWRQCKQCPPETKEHPVLPKIYHESVLPWSYLKGEYICEKCLQKELDRLDRELDRHTRLVETITQELQRREQIYQQAGW